MSLSDNVAMGKKAVIHVKSIVGGASNQRSDRLASMGGVEKIVDIWRNADPADRSNPLLGFETPVEEDVGSMRQDVKKAIASSPDTHWLKHLADQAKKAKVGNCGEQAAIAYLWLFHQGVTPIDYMAFASKEEKKTANGGKDCPPYLDHAFVVIGRETDSDLCDLRTWGDEAVWCDPWQLREGRVFGIGDFIKGKVRNLDWQFRLDSASRVEEGMPMCRVRNS